MIVRVFVCIPITKGSRVDRFVTPTGIQHGCGYPYEQLNIARVEPQTGCVLGVSALIKQRLVHLARNTEEGWSERCAPVSS